MSSRRRTMLEWWRLFGGHATASVIPYGAESRTIKRELRGKVPGTLNPRTGQWSGTTDAVVGRFMTEAEARRADEDGASVGIYGDIFPAIDIDVDDEVLVREIIASAFKIFGLAPIRRREGSARCLLMYAGRSLRRRRIAWGGGENAKESAVELLARGQYWNADGLHPSGKPYYWNDHPCDLGVHDIIEITAEQWDTFQAGVAALVEGSGQTVKVSGVKTAHAASGARTSLDDPSLWAPSPQVVLDLLAGYRPEVLGHNEFVTHMVAIKAALGSSREDYYPNVLEWAPGVRSTEDEATRKVWDSIDEAEVGWNWLVDKSGSPAAATADFQDAPSDDAMPVDPGELKLREIRQRWVYDVRNDCFHDIFAVADVSKDSFNIINTDFLPYGKPRKIAATVCLNDKGMRRVDGTVYVPGGEIPLIRDGERVMANRWRPSKLKRRQGDAGPWLKLVDKLFPDPAIRNHVLDYLAFVVQNPGKKIGHAMIWYSQQQGVGKDTALDPFLHAIGMENIAKIEPEDITGQFTDHLGKQVIICNEMMNFERNSVYNRFKSFLEMSSKYLTVNPKYGKKYDTKNHHIWIFCTNHANAISLEVGDRRLFVCECPSIVFAGKEADEIYAWYAKDDDFGRGVVFDFLMERDISKFNPAHPPPMTAAKIEMTELAKTQFERWADRNFGHRQFITVIEIREIGTYGEAPPEVHSQMLKDENWRIVKWLRINKFEALPNRVKIEGNDNVTIWARNPTPEIMATTGQFLVQHLVKDRKKKA